LIEASTTGFCQAATGSACTEIEVEITPAA